MNKNPFPVFAKRLQLARKMRGFSLQKLSDLLENKVTKQALSKYEQGKMFPSAEVLISLAKVLELDIDYFSRPFTVDLPDVDFRKRAKLEKKEIDRIKEITRDQLERYLEIENFLKLDKPFSNPIENLQIQKAEDAEIAADRLRTEWNLGYDPLPNVVEMLEENGIKVIELDAPDSFDGMAAKVGNTFLIVLNKNQADLVRKRFTTVHELGHLLMNLGSIGNLKLKESCCNAFAGAFLLPSNSLKAEIGEKRTRLSIGELIPIKNYYGLSIAAIIFRAKQSRIIPDHFFKDFWKWRNQNDERRREIGLGNYLGREGSSRFEQLVLRAVNEELITSSKGANLLGISMRKLREKLILKWA
ncbi:MAG: ImmA/IrrE family metallo-endopeptidase [Crocinitomicaceae bacterium]|nr:ImmA/IrrE family metallo-endopeptidase [Crocinitomicaceae bacterium]